VRRRQNRINQLFTGAKIPARYGDFSWDNLVLNKDILDEVKNHDLNGKKNSLFLFGDYGVGKTALAIVFLKQKMTEEKAGLFISVPDLLDRIRAAFDKDERYTADDIIEEAKNIDLLLLDDLGAEKPSEWVKEKLFQIINHRYNELLPIVFTSNLSLDELEKRIGERIVARIAEMSKMIRLIGKNLRAD
jgi:DNA replication protein DnaC